ncbi:hypothetical protein JZU68_05480 [bacterium]|jgi:hypothetical protein|nr:hypothetical protein [bacterium]
MKAKMLLLIFTIGLNASYSQINSIKIQNEESDTTKAKVATDISISNLIWILTMPSSMPQEKNWTPAAHPECKVTAIESINPKALFINRTITKLTYQFTCTRNDASYNCGGGWSPKKDDSYNSVLTADLKYSDGVLYISNFRISPTRSDAETNCQIDIINHLKSFSGKKFEIEFKNMPN